MAERFRSRPSALVGLQSESEYLAYCFDEAVYVFGTVVDAELNKAEKGAKGEKQAAGKRLSALNRMLNEGAAVDKEAEEAPKPTGRFRDPASLGK